MCKEIISLHIGQAGVQASHALWELVCIEHGIGSNGEMRESSHNAGENIDAMYYEIKNSRFVPRAILMDLEPTVLDEVRTGAYRELWHPSNLINQKEDAASNYARGYYTSGKAFLKTVIDRLDHEIERCENLSAFEIIHSFAGGTGSGFTSLLSEKLSELYGKVFKFSLGVFPSPRLSEIMVESYNAVLHAHTSLNSEDCVIIFDNESLFNKSIEKLGVSQPTFSLMNRLISQMFSSVFLSHRYSFLGSQHADVTELLTNLVPYPRIHFPVMSYSPLISFSEQKHEVFNCARLTTDVFRDHNHVLQCSLRENKFMSCCMLYRGSVSPKPIIDAIAKIKTNREINFVEWCPTGFKIGINTCPPIQIPNCVQAVGDNALCMISGNTAVRRNWSGIVSKFDMLMSKHAFVHWYVSEGLEEGEFIDAREDVQSLILDYEELSNQSLDEPSADTNNMNDGNANNSTNYNGINRNNSVLSNVTNRRFQNKYNQLYFPDEIEDMEIDLSLNTDDVISCKLIKDDVKLSKNRSVQTNQNTCKISNTRNRSKNIIKIFDKCEKTLLKCQKVIEKKKSIPFSTAKRNRHVTKDLEIKDIQSTVKRYLGDKANSKEKSIATKQSFQTSVQKKSASKCLASPLVCDSEINMSHSYCSSIDDFIRKCERMKNNNRDSSNMSSLTGSFKTAQETNKISSIAGRLKVKKKSIVVNQLLYRSIDKCDFNSIKHSTDFETTLNSKDQTINSNLLRLSQPNNTHIKDDKLLQPRHDLPSNNEKTTYLTDETLKPSPLFRINNFVEKIKERHLEFSKIEIVSCDPLFTLEKSLSFTNLSKPLPN